MLWDIMKDSVRVSEEVVKLTKIALEEVMTLLILVSFKSIIWKLDLLLTSTLKVLAGSCLIQLVIVWTLLPENPQFGRLESDN